MICKTELPFKHNFKNKLKQYGLKVFISYRVKMLSSFTHTQVFSNLCESLSSAELKRRYSEEWQPNI